MDYAAKAAAADRMIRAYGAAGVLVSTAAVYDSATGTTTATETRQDVQMVAFAYPQKFVDGTLVRQGDLQAFVSAVGITAPKPGDGIEWGGVARVVVTVKPLAPALLAVLFECQLRA